MEVTHKWEVAVNSTEPRRVAEQFEETAMEQGVPMETVFKFQLALDEILTNVVSYAFPETPVDDASVRVHAHFGPTAISAVIEDNGKPFNPLEDAPSPDLELSAEGRQIGGLGIHLTRSFVDSIAYERTNGWNRLILKQPIKVHMEKEPE